MQLDRPFTRRHPRRLASLAMAAVLGLAACNQEDQSAGPVLPPNPVPNPQITQAAFLANVNVRTGQIAISAPRNTVLSLSQGAWKGPNASVAAAPIKPSFSLIGGDVINLTTSNFFASAVGAFQPGKVRVTFDVNITNKLSSVELIGPTVFPTPPPGSTGILLFPFDIAVATTSGGTSTGGQGNDVIVNLPSYGLVAPSTDWTGAPFNFFNDASCPSSPTPPSDCYRYEEYPAPLAAGGTSAAQGVGFDLDPTVGQFTARLILAADLRNSGPAPTGTVAGTVTSPQLGALTGVTVNVTGGFSGTTGAGGTYSIGSVNVGARTVSLTNLPTGCTTPASQGVTVTNGGTATADFSVTCPTPIGTITGTISSSLGGTLSGIGVTITPAGLGALAPVSTNGSGVYSNAAVPVGSGNGSLAFSNVPSNCTNPGTQTYTGLTNGGTVTRDFTFACTPAPTFYNVTHSWSGTGSTRTLTIRIDMTTRNDPAVNGASPDDIGAFQGTLVFDPTKIQPVNGSESSTTAPRLGNVAVQTYVSGSTLNYGAFDAVAGGRLGNVGVIQIDFAVQPGFAAGTSTSITSQLQSGATLFGNSSVASGNVGYGAAVVNVISGNVTN